MSEDAPAGGMDAGRLKAFSDGVIAVVITIMVLELKPPSTDTPAALLAVWPVFLAYVLSFLLVAIYWVNHHHLFKVARLVGARSLWLNILWLFCLSLYPFSTAYLGKAGIAPLPVALYAVVSALTVLAYLLLGRDLSGRNAHVEIVRAIARGRQRKGMVASAANIVAVPVAFVSPAGALVLLAAPAVAYFWPSRKVESHV